VISVREETTVPADFLANDFGAIARAMERETSSPRAVLHFWDMLTLLSSEHESVEAAVEEAYVLLASHSAIPERITATDGAVLLDGKALTDAMVRYREGMPV
jgi:hypothetical protein